MFSGYMSWMDFQPAIQINYIFCILNRLSIPPFSIDAFIPCAPHQFQKFYPVHISTTCCDSDEWVAWCGERLQVTHFPLSICRNHHRLLKIKSSTYMPKHTGQPKLVTVVTAKIILAYLAFYKSFTTGLLHPLFGHYSHYVKMQQQGFM